MNKNKTKTEDAPTMSKSYEIKWLDKAGQYNQIYNEGLQYAFVSKDNEQCFPFAFCKDYLQDSIMATHHKTSCAVYGFKYDAKKDPPVDLEVTRLAVRNKKDLQFANKIVGVLNFLKQIEKQLKLKRSTAFKAENSPTDNNSDVFIFEGSSKWMLSPPMISLYTLFIRVGFCHKIGDTYETTINNVISGKVEPYQRNDKSYLESAKPAIDRILKIGYYPFFKSDAKANFPNINIHTMHNNMGIVSFVTAKDTQKAECPHWHRKLKKKKTAEEKADANAPVVAKN